MDIELTDFPDGIIEPDTPMGKKLGFTSDLLDGYLWKMGNCIFVSFVISRQKRKGNLNKLFDNILSMNYIVKVPSPIGVMEDILVKKGFEHTIEKHNMINNDVHVWVKYPEVKEMPMPEMPNE